MHPSHNYAARPDLQIERDLHDRAIRNGERLRVEPLTLSCWQAELADVADPGVTRIEARAASRRAAMVALLHKDDRLRRRAA